jgi:hypothetical protein
MGDYYCGICGYITYSKSSMDRHNMRKKPCKPKKILPSSANKNIALPAPKEYSIGLNINVE